MFVCFFFFFFFNQTKENFEWGAEMRIEGSKNCCENIFFV